MGMNLGGRQRVESSCAEVVFPVAAGKGGQEQPGTVVEEGMLVDMHQCLHAEGGACTMAQI